VSEVVRAAVEEAYRPSGRRVLATLIRLLGGFDVAEEAMQEALPAPPSSGRATGSPPTPDAWLVSTGRFRTIDRWRRQRGPRLRCPTSPASETEAPMDEPDAIPTTSCG
jgi:RNA polymerase sigma-70 factor (ECF subfamily)